MNVPAVRPALSRVGLMAVEAVVPLGVDQRSAQPLPARFECFIEPDPGRLTAGPPRFEEVIREALRDVLADCAATRAERIAQELAERVRERQAARRVEVAIAAPFPERRSPPLSGAPTQAIAALLGRAVATGRGTRRMVGVAARGMATSPHGRSVAAARTRERLAASGFSAAQIASVLEAVPTATHDQIGMGTLHLGLSGECAQEFDAAALLLIVERAMSSESFEPMKRDDEGASVGRAHRRPRWVEDCVHAMIAGVVERFADASDGVFVSAEQDVDGAIHGHRLTAQRAGLLGDLRRELRTGEPTVSRTSMRRWLDADGR